MYKHTQHSLKACCVVTAGAETWGGCRAVCAKNVTELLLSTLASASRSNLMQLP